MKTRAFSLSLFVTALATLFGASACDTEAYCFRDCEDGIVEREGGLTDGGGPDVVIRDGGTGGLFNLRDTGADCGVAEICNNLDDDCDGEIDEDFDFESPLQCGTCANNCRAILQFVESESIGCIPPTSGAPGTTAGTCTFQACANDYWNADKDDEPTDTLGCEYYCEHNPDRTNTTDPGWPDGCNDDDDCDGETDEDVDTCSISDCGKCGNNCSIPNGTPICKTSAAQGQACTEANTACAVGSCLSGWHNNDGKVENGCEYECTPSADQKEICNNLDDDCDGNIDNLDDEILVDDANVGDPCFGDGTGVGECGKTYHRGVKKCVGGQIECCDPSSNTLASAILGKTGLQNGKCLDPSITVAQRCNDTTKISVLETDQCAETCNLGKDDDCDGLSDANDNNLTGAGSFCGPSKGSCVQGREQCIDGALVCTGGTTEAQFDYCNGSDEDCDGIVDGTLPNEASPVACGTGLPACPSGQQCMPLDSGATSACATPAADVGQPCQVPPSAPCVLPTGAPAACTTAGAVPAPQACSGGIEVCSGGVRICQGAVLPQSGITDKCGEDTNCNGILDNQPRLLSDTNNCGQCGKVCGTGTDNAQWICQNGSCVKSGCLLGFIDCTGQGGDADPNTCERACVYSGNELCNDFDDDCDCQKDEAADLTGKPTAQQVCGVSPFASTQCQSTQVSCTAGKWTCGFASGICTTGDCATSPDKCDGIDNNCNGAVDEGFKQPIRNSRYLDQTCFSDDGLPAPGHGDCRGEGMYVCNTAGDDTVCSATRVATNAGQELCDGSDNDCDGLVDETNTTTADTNGNFVQPNVVQIGSFYMFQYEASRPDATATTPGNGTDVIACSVAGNIPWFNVSPDEAEDACAAIGGQVCTLTEWQTACEAANGCDWAYSPVAACTQPANYSTGPFCNLGAYDVNASVAGNQDGVVVTADPSLMMCYSPATSIYDLTGNLREMTAASGFYTLMGGAFNTSVEAGAACDFTFFSVSSTFRLYDTGFRCCFNNDPRLPLP